MSMQTAKNSVLSLQRMKAANSNDTTGSNVSVWCKKNSTVSAFACVLGK
ncbi:class III lanthipeptide [Bacillus sp. NPDC094106]